jgi:hypothetical protein
MAPKGKDAGKGKGKAKATDDDGSGGAKLKPAQSINVRHILVKKQRGKPVSSPDKPAVRKTLQERRGPCKTT